MNDALEKLIRPHFRALPGYVSAAMEAAKDGNHIFLNANENPYSLPGLEELNRYPDPQPAPLLAAYAKAYGIRPGQVFASRGSGEAIALLCRIFCDPQDNIIACPPTFMMFAHNAKIMPAGIIDIPLLKKDGDFKLDKESIIKTAQDKNKNVKMVFLCAPNNPTGTLIPHEDIEEICRALEGHAAVILDEAYVEFSASPSFAAKMGAHSNLIILRTLSKAYGLAGARMGAALCADEDFITLMQAKAADPYPMSKGSVKAAIKALSMQKEIKENIGKILAERERLAKALAASPLASHIYPSDTNFILVEMKDAKGFYDFCAGHNLFLRDFSSRPGTESCIRISVGTPQENDFLIELLDKFSTAQKAASA